MTVRAAQALALADVLVVDRLAPAALWEDSVSDVRVIDVGKEPGKHAVSQDEINKILVREASAGYNVVRIKVVIHSSSVVAARRHWPARQRESQ